MWKADLLEVIDETDNRRSKSPDLSESKIEEHIENESARQPPSRQNKISDLSDDTESDEIHDIALHNRYKVISQISQKFGF